MSKFLTGLRISVMSVHEGWWYAYLVVFFLQMAAWTAMIAWDEAVYGDHARVVAYLRAVGESSSRMVQLFVLNTIGVVELGRLMMVLAERMAQRLKERKERFRNELIAQGKAEGIAEGETRGRAEGRAEVMTEVEAWNERRLTAEAKGEPFDEPLPGFDDGQV